MKQSVSASRDLILTQTLERRIFLIRGHKVMLDADLAALYGVPTSSLNQAVRRNIDRFPSDFMFQLNKEELASWKSQIVISNPAARMGLRKSPYAFTEHGVAMLSSVLRSKRAVAMNILIIRAFVRLRELLATHKDLARKIGELEQRQDHQAMQIDAIVKRLIDGPKRRKRTIGFIDSK